VSQPTDVPFAYAAVPDVLVIEDVPNVTRLIRASLADKHVTIDSVTDGREGLLRAKATRPSLILLDLALPSMHGFEILRELRADEDTASIPVIVLTAQSDSQTALEAKRLGANRFLSKPFLPNELRRAIDSFLDRVAAEPD
jgi:CheY-like chemotaxis protein